MPTITSMRCATISRTTQPAAYSRTPSVARASKLINSFPTPSNQRATIRCRGSMSDPDSDLSALGWPNGPLLQAGTVPAPSSDSEGNKGALEKSEYAKFVQFFRQASPYIEGHREKVFVIVVPGLVRDRLSSQNLHLSPAETLCLFGPVMLLCVTSSMILRLQNLRLWNSEA